MPHSLIHRWMQLCGRLGVADNTALICGMNLLDSYKQRGRAYHNETHLRDVLDKLDWARGALAASGELEGMGAVERQKMLDTVELALWYHDAVYDAKARDNEAQSRALLLDHAAQMHLPGEIRDRAAALIDLTARHADAKTLPERIMADCDLAIFGADRKTFAKYDSDIRKEYAHVPAAEWKARRPKVLRHFLDQKPIYKTQAFRDRYEETARNNLARALQSPVQKLMRPFR